MLKPILFFFSISIGLSANAQINQSNILVYLDTLLLSNDNYSLKFTPTTDSLGTLNITLENGKQLRFQDYPKEYNNQWVSNFYINPNAPKNCYIYRIFSKGMVDEKLSNFMCIENYHRVELTTAIRLNPPKEIRVCLQDLENYPVNLISTYTFSITNPVFSTGMTFYPKQGVSIPSIDR